MAQLPTEDINNLLDVGLKIGAMSEHREAAEIIYNLELCIIDAELNDEQAKKAIKAAEQYLKKYNQQPAQEGAPDE